jgi:GT2 family glycosyltransferase
MSCLRVSAAIVVYRTDPAVLRRALASLAASIEAAKGDHLVSAARIVVVVNDPGEMPPALAPVIAEWPAAAGDLEVLRGHGNVGYGRANNLALARVESDIHLVMNPDVELDRAAVPAVMRAFCEHSHVSLVAPAVRGEDGAPQYLCKRYPSVWVLFLRGFAPAALRRRFAGSLSRYEMRDLIGDHYLEHVTLASGCFMAARTQALRRVGGFDPRFFMYFEDYDLTLRMAHEGTVAYVPQARIVHLGGEASRKGWRHVAWFVTSAWRFFRRHGWKLV